MGNLTGDITEFINAIRKLTGIGICFYDLNSFFGYDRYGVKNNRGHYCEFCKKTRELSDGRIRCDESDKNEAISLAKQYKTPFFFECHMGMQELVIPLICDGFLLGVLFVGQCRTSPVNSEKIRENAQKLNGNPDELLELYNSLPLVSKEDVLSIGVILEQYFNTKILSSELLRPITSPHMGNTDVAEAIRNYIRQNYRYPLSTKKIADAFFINASYASRCFSERYDMTITEYILKIRIDCSKKYLSTTTAPISSISLNVGFEDPNYFTRVFKKITGCSPTQYRLYNQNNG